MGKGQNKKRRQERSRLRRQNGKEKSMNTDRNVWEFYVDAADRHRWRVFDKNGLELACSSQGYADIRDAQICARRFGWTEDAQSDA